MSPDENSTNLADARRAEGSIRPWTFEEFRNSAVPIWMLLATGALTFSAIVKLGSDVIVHAASIDHLAAEHEDYKAQLDAQEATLQAANTELLGNIELLAKRQTSVQASVDALSQQLEKLREDSAESL